MMQSRLQSISLAAAPDEVRRQLDKLVASPWFARSGRMCRFLRFAVEHALAGTGNEIKEYVVGVEVFDRTADYDPRVDPIVRVEARRLRAKLEAYYASTGKNDAVLIEFPKGTYAATCRARAQHVNSTEARPATIAVLPFANLSREAGNDYFSHGLREELIALLTLVQGLRVLAWYTVPQFPRCERDLSLIGRETRAGTILGGSLRRTGTRVRVTAQLIETESGAYLWSEAFEPDTEDEMAIQMEIARAIVDRVSLTLAPTEPRSGQLGDRTRLSRSCGWSWVTWTSESNFNATNSEDPTNEAKPCHSLTP